MRIRLNFLLDKNSTDELCELKVKKIIFPIDLNEIFTVKDLKIKLNKLLEKKEIVNYNNLNNLNNVYSTTFDNSKYQNVQVDNLFLDNFLLIDEFGINFVLNNYDEIRYSLYLNISLVFF